MDLSQLDKQTPSEKTLKGFLLKNVDYTATEPIIKELNEFLIGRVDKFWEQVVIPLQEINRFDYNKLQWYFDLYKEGIDVHAKNSFDYVEITTENVERLMNFLKPLTLTQYASLGPSFLANSFSVLSYALRQILLQYRAKNLYCYNNPVEWIITAEDNPKLLEQASADVNDLIKIINNVGLLMSRKV